MIITLTMNPAIDKTVEIDDFQINHVNRIKDVHLDAAGKGINVSKVIKALGGRTKTIAFLGGENGEFIKGSLDKDRINLVSVPIKGNTRVNTKVVDFTHKTFTDLNEVGPMIDEKSLHSFEKQLINYASSQSLVVCTGSVPPGVPKTIYRDYIKRLNGFGAKTVLDASGDLFAEGIKGIPTIIKPNIHELEVYAGCPLEDENSILKVCRKFIEMGIEIVVVSLGAHGALMMTKDYTYKAKGLLVDVKSTVGAGDAMVAAICYGYEKNFSKKEIFELAIASSAAQVTVKGTQPPNLDIIYKLIKSVEITEI